MKIHRVKMLVIGPPNKKTHKLRDVLGKAGIEITNETTDGGCPSIIALTGKKTLSISQEIEDQLGSCNPDDGLLTVNLGGMKIPSRLANTRVFNLTRWRGSENNPVFQDLLNAIVYKEFEPVRTKPTAFVSQTIKRWCTGLTITAVSGAAIFFAFNILSLQNNLCSINFAQPHISDFCGNMGLGGKPTKVERIAWGRVSPKSCDALRTHIETFSTGAFRDDAADLLEARRIIPEETWSPVQRSLSLFVGQDGESAVDQENAQKSSLKRGQETAQRLCSSFSNTSVYKILSSNPKVNKWSCTTYTSGIVCGFEGQAVCNLEVKQIVEREECGASR